MPVGTDFEMGYGLDCIISALHREALRVPPQGRQDCVLAGSPHSIPVWLRVGKSARSEPAKGLYVCLRGME